MRNLFFKIFAIFWIAQSLIFVISTALIVQHRFPSPDILLDSLFSGLRNEARESTTIYETSGCGALGAYATEHEETIALVDATGRNVCTGSIEDQGSNSRSTPFPDHISGRQVGRQYIWRVPVISPTANKSYIFLLSRSHIPEHHSWYDDLLHFAFPQLPVAIAVGGATTFVLVLLFTRPLVKLRMAARSLAQGNLKTRIDESSSQSRFLQGDEVQALVRDFNHMAERLESLVDAQQLLLRDVSHELRSPLARLNVALELAREDTDPEAKIEPHLLRIERETERLSKLIGQLLTLSSMEAIDQVKSFEPVSLNDLIGQIIPDAMYEAKQRQCSISFRADAECAVWGNRDLLYRAIENVVRNAIRYTAPGSEVEINLRTTPDENHRQVLLEVSDRGPGIPEDEILYIFRPFYRVDRARSPETGGFGVGLAIAERAVKLHRGEVAATNRPGGGTTVRLSFPIFESGQNTKPEPKIATQSS